MPLTRRAHKSEETGAPRKMHLRIRLKAHMYPRAQMTCQTHISTGMHPAIPTRSPQGIHRPKMSPKGHKKGSADPLLGPFRPSFLQQSPTAPLHPSRTCIVPPRKSNRGSTLGEAI